MGTLGITTTAPHMPAEQRSIRLPPFDIQYLRDRTELVEQHGNWFRIMGKSIHWFEDPEIASCASHVAYINAVVDEIVACYPDRDRPLTLVSFGAGGLLTEAMIHRQLVHQGYREIHWRAIDIEFFRDEGVYANAANDFRTVFTPNFLTFPTEQAYFNYLDRQPLASDRDGLRGPVVVLAVNPPSRCDEKPLTQPQVPTCMVMAGFLLAELDHANSIGLIKSERPRRDELDAMVANLADTSQVIECDHALQCWIDPGGDVHIRHSPSEGGRGLNSEAKKALLQMLRKCAKRGRRATMAHIDRALANYVDRIESNSNDILKKFYLSDYYIALNRLSHRFIDGRETTLLATLENNHTSLTRVTAPAPSLPARSGTRLQNQTLTAAPPAPWQDNAVALARIRPWAPDSGASEERDTGIRDEPAATGPRPAPPGPPSAQGEPGAGLG